MPRRKKQVEPSSPFSSSAPSSDESTKQQQPKRRSKRKTAAKTPTPRGRPKGARNKNKQEPTPYSTEDFVSENENEENDYDEPQRQTADDPPLASGMYCRKHSRRRANKNAYAHIRTLYSKFPRDYFRLIILNILATFIIYLIVYPFINLLWSFFINIDDEVSTLFRYISEEPTYEGGFFSHCQKMRWLALPPFSAEIASLMIAASIKDTVVLHWEGIMDDISLTEIVTGQIARRYRH